MSLQSAFNCDFCGKDRRADANHWWILWTDPTDALVIARWELVIDTNKPDPGDRHACGRACTLRAVERFMATGSMAEPPEVPEAKPARRPET